MSDAVYIATTRHVPAEHRENFLAQLKEFVAKSHSVPGVLDAYIISDSANGDEVGILRSFADDSAKVDFYNSSVYQEWAKVAENTFGAFRKNHRQLHGLEAFFRHSHPSGDAIAVTPPPQPAVIKMALVTYLGVTPTVAIWMFLIQPAVGFGPIAGLFLSNVFIVAMLTWIVMPLLTTVLKPWLIPSSPKN